MSNSITNFTQFKLALNGLANHPRVGVVPTIRGGQPAFGPSDMKNPIVPSVVRDEHADRYDDVFDVMGFAARHDDAELMNEISYLDRILQTKMGDLLPDDRFFGREITQAQAGSRDVIKRQVTMGFRAPDEEAGPHDGASQFMDMTVENIARRLATKAYLKGGGYGHEGLVDAILTRGYVRMADRDVEPSGYMISGATLLAHMRTQWAYKLAEATFVAAAAALVQYGRHSRLLAAIMYGFAADMRDERAGGVEQDNPLRATAARGWLASTENPQRDPDIGARVFFGMSEAYKAGDMDTYVQLASTYAGTLLRKQGFYERLVDIALYMVRGSWAMAEQVEQGRLPADRAFWGGMKEDMGLAGDYFSKKGDYELAEIATRLYNAAFDMES